MFNNSEPRYLLNELYITDYCIWIQKISEKRIMNLLELFQEREVRKSELGLELEELEEAALIVKDEEELDIVSRLMGVTLSDGGSNESSDAEEEVESRISSESETDLSSSETSADSSLDSDDISSEEEQ